MNVQALATELNKQQCYSLEINDLVIDGLKVYVAHDFISQKLKVTSMDTDEMLFESSEFCETSTTEMLAACIEKTRSKLEQLYYYKPLGKLLARDNPLELLTYKVFKKFTKPNEDCSVCFEETSVHTNCNHYCCHKCMQEIKLCPICRRDLYE